MTAAARYSERQILIRSLLFGIAMWSWTAVIGVVWLPAFIFSRGGALSVGKPWARGVLWLARVICGITHEVRGQQYYTHMPVLYASKHQSAWDTIIFLELLDHPAYVLKRSLLALPIFGQYLARMGMIAIDRKGGNSTLKHMAAQAHRALSREQRPIVIFPEGTRRALDAKPRYHPGIASLYQQLKVPVVPVALNSGTVWGRNAFRKKPGRIILQFLEPIPPGLDNRTFLKTLSRRIEDASRELIAEALDPNYRKPEPEEDF